MISLKNTGRSNLIVLLGHLGALITVSAWGASFICTKILMAPSADGGAGFTPVEMFAYRFAFAYLLLLAITCTKRLLANNWRDELNFLVCGICSGSLYFITENVALLHTTAGNVSLLASISPIFTTILLAIVFRMKIKGGVILGSVIAFIGVGCIIFSSGDGLEIHPAGDLLALSAALSWAIYTIVVKKLIPLYNTLFITRKLFFYGVLTALPLLLLQKEPYHLKALFDFNNPEYLLNFLFLSIVCSLVAYIIWNETMKALGSVTANNYLYMQPLVTMIAAVIVFHDPITMLGIIGCVLIIGGLVISDKVADLKLLHRKRKKSSDTYL